MLRRLQSLDAPIRTLIVGAGAMGKGLFYQCHITPGFECLGLADIDLDRAIACAEWLDKPYRVVETLDALHDAMNQGYVALCEDGDLLARCEHADVFIESSNAIVPAAQFSKTAIEHDMDLVLMNAEIDLIYGPYLADLARQHDVVYTSCDGDQHTVLKHLIDKSRLWGFEVVMAGNIKGYLDRYANPTSIIPEADKRNLDYEMCTAYTDGTKLNIEMALVANALGYKTDVPGMHGPRAEHVNDVFDLFDLDRLWDGSQPLVDYILGAEPGGGVFVIGYCDEPYQQDMLQYYKMGDGPYYLFYRPYHLCHIEALEVAAWAHLDDRSLLQPTYGFQTNVYAYAKHDLKADTSLDGIGGYHCYGMIENRTPDTSRPEHLPICLADDVKLRRDVPKDAPIRFDDVAYDEAAPAFALYRNALAASAKTLRPANLER